MKTKSRLYICCFICLLSFEGFGQKKMTFFMEGSDYLNGTVKNITLKYFDASEKFGNTVLNIKGENNFSFTPDGRINSIRIHDGNDHFELKLTKDTLEIKAIKKSHEWEIADQSDSTISENDQGTIDSLDTTSTEYLTRFVYKGRRVIERKEFRNGSLTSVEVYKYDSNDRLIEQSEYGKDGELKSKNTKVFNQAGQIIETTNYWHIEKSTTYEKYQYSYNGKNIVREDNLDQANELVSSTAYKYNALGNLLQEIRTYKGEVFGNIYYRYNTKNQPIEEVYRYKNVTEIKTLYKYDVKARITQKTTYTLNDGNWIVENKREYEYTPDGKVKTDKGYLFTNGKLESIHCTETEFDHQGNWVTDKTSSAHSPNFILKTDRIENGL